MKSMIKKSFICAFAALATLAVSAFDTPYLTFRSPTSFTLKVSSPTYRQWDGTIEYSTDATTWTIWDGNLISSALSDGQHRLYLRGSNNTIITGSSSLAKWELTGSDISCDGDIETLRNYEGNPSDMVANCYQYMFYQCTALIKAPMLSATKLADNCYQNMFRQCSNLTSAPELPATALAPYCYSSMFRECTSLVESPELPATTLADSCYSYMFRDCTSLKSLPGLSATVLSTSCYFYMFNGCSSLKVNTEGPGVEWSIPAGATGSVSTMFGSTGGSFTGAPVKGTTYYVASALPPGLSFKAGADRLAVYVGENVVFDLSDTIKGGETPYSFALKAGSVLPGTLALSGANNATLSGVVSAAGVYVFTNEVTDSSSTPLTLDAIYTLTVTAPDPLSAQTNLGTMKVGKSASFALADTVSGGVPPYTFASSAALPSGFSLSGGVLSATPASASTYVIGITVTDKLGTVLNTTYSLEAVEAVGFMDDDPDEPESGVTVDCLTPDGAYPRTCNTVSSSSSAVIWENSWYYVSGNVTLSAGVTVNGKVSLILGDGATLTVSQSVDNKAGINVSTGNSLTIYGEAQSVQTGKLVVTGSSNYGAGIGGGDGEAAGTINICGGDITANGGFWAAGIGGGQNGDGGKLTVYGGSVSAKGSFCPGIGAGKDGVGGVVTVKGGYVFAESGSTSYPGIGARGSKGQGSLKIDGDNIVVKAGASATLTDSDIQTPDSEGNISLSTARRYYVIETTGPAPLAQTTSTLVAYTGEVAVFDLAETVSGGTSPYVFAPKGGESLPAGFTLSGSILTNDSASAGGTFVMTVTDSGSPAQVANFTYTLTVSAPDPLATAQTDLGSAVKGKSFAANLNTLVSGGIPPYTFALAQGSSMPDGLSFDNGAISGAPTVAGSHSFTVSVTDSASLAQVTNFTYTLCVKDVYGITYKDREGTGNLSLTPSSYVEGTGVASLPTPTMAGWVFVSWHYDSSLLDAPVASIPASATGDKILYSKWEENLSGTVPMTFLDVDGSSRTENCVVIDSTTTTLNSGWYTVANDITFSSKTLTVAGDVKIVLRDGKTMTITGEYEKAGVSVASGYSLSIYGQSAGTGTLSTKGNWYGAGIGGDKSVDCGTVTINGGTIIATGGKDAAGIGGGLDADGGIVVINGGNITVKSDYDGAGIGGGKNGDGGTLTVNGGSVSVHGNEYGSTSPGVGGGVGSTQHGKLYVGEYMSVMAGNRSNQMTERTPDANGEIALGGEIFFAFASTKPVSVSYLDTDGVVKSTNCVILASGSMQLSNGWYAVTSSMNYDSGLTVLDDVKLIIADGVTLTVSAGTAYGTAGIAVCAGNSLTVYSQEAGTGVLNATGTDSGAGIGGSNGNACGSVTINGCTINATGGGSAAGIGGGYTAAGGTVVVNGGTVNATGGNKSPGIGGGFGDNVAQGTLTVAEGLIVKAGASANPEGTPTRDLVTNEITLGKERYYVIAPPDASTEFQIVYMDGASPLDLSPSTFTYGAGLASLPTPTPAYGFAFDGWYDNADFEGLAVTSIPAGLTVGVTLYAKWKPAVVSTTFIGADGSQTEDCTVLIAERHELSSGWYVVEGALDYGNVGIAISGDVNLVLKDGASITVAGKMYNAGISVPAGSSLAIYAQSEGEGMGALRATGGYRGAGIGGGDGVAAGTIAIYGGDIAVQGGGYAAGIGGGYMSDGGDVTIDGGTVNAIGGVNGAGIGSGPGSTLNSIICNGGTVTINGGSVTATGGELAAGIGGGQVGNGAAVVVNGGTVVATGGDDSQAAVPVGGISCGFGSNLNPGTLTVAETMAVKAGSAANPTTVFVRNPETGAVTISLMHYVTIAAAQSHGIVYMDGANEITGLLPDEYTEGVGADLPGKNDVVKDGWSFQGWFKDALFEDGPVFAVAPTVSGVQTFYAKFIEGGETPLVQTQSELDGVQTGSLANWDVSWTVDGGLPPYTFAVKEGTRLPPGLKLSGSTVSGILADAGTYKLYIAVSDSTGPIAQSIDAEYTITVTGEHVDPHFSINDAGTLIAANPKGNVTVTIPETVRGISVRALGGALFKDCDYLEQVTIHSGVTNIMNGAFENCTALPSIEIPSSVACIGNRAFYGCTALASISIPDGVGEIGILSFCDCTALASIAIPGSVTTVGSSAFSGCTALTNVTFGNGVATISDRAFMGCEGLTGVSFPDSVVTVGDSAFARCYGITSVTLGDGVETIGDSTFISCTNLATLTFGANLATIGEGAFFACEALADDGVNGFYIPDSVTSLGDVAFRGTSIEKASLPGALYAEGTPADGAFNLTAKIVYRTNQVVYHVRSDGLLWSVDLSGNTVVNIPSGVKEIGPAAFEGCDSITAVTIPTGVTNISTRAFYGCSSLASVNVPDGVLSIGMQAFASCTNLAEIAIPDSTTQIGSGVFWGCTSLESAIIGSGVTVIPDMAFLDCESLATVTVSGNIESIETRAFEGCSALTEVNLPDSLATIESWAFGDCVSLSELTIPKGVEIGLCAFAHCTGLVRLNVSGEVKRRVKLTALRLSAAPAALLGAPSNPDATTIGGYAFYGCDALEDVTIGATVEDIGGGAFSGCSSIKSIDVDSNNDNYKSDNGMLLTKDGTTLISAFGEETAITVPDSVVTVAEGAFSGYATLTSVVLQSGVTTIGEAAFSNATVFATITIPNSVTTIGANAFCGTALATANVAKGDTARVKALVEGTGYAGTVAYVEPGDEGQKPSISGDSAATVTGDETSGYTITPSTTENTIEVNVPAGIDATNVTVVLPPTATVKPNGANVAVVKTANETTYNITEFLNIPAPNASGIVDLSAATVKEQYVTEVLDKSQHEEVNIVLTPTAPSITTAPTRSGLTYTLWEGTTLEGMAASIDPEATKVGDGTSWTPKISVKGGTSGFYSIHVTK